MSAHDLRQLFVLANAFKEGDQPFGATTDDRLRNEARQALLATTLGEIRRFGFVEDDLTLALDRSRDRSMDSSLDGLTIAQVKTLLLGPGAASWTHTYRQALPSETIAAVAKVMTNDELSSVARVIFNPLPGDGVAIGAAPHFGSRIQPNSPGDDAREILFSILEGLSDGCGDVIIGLNPASDDVDTIERLERLLERVVRQLALPTRYCVLSDILKQQAAGKRTRIDVGFQSLAGTSAALVGMVSLDVDGVLEAARGFDGLYFETGQGSAVTNGAAAGVDMVTLESRAYGAARYIREQLNCPWTIVNDVAGFIGPEVFSTAAQLERACLEDSVMAKLHGLTMGLDVCATFHMGIAPAELRRLTSHIAAKAAPAYLMAVAGNADPMLGYLTTSFRDHDAIRRGTRRRMASPMERRLTILGALMHDGSPHPGTDTIARLYAAYQKAGGDFRTVDALEDEGRAAIAELRTRGMDLGGLDPLAADARLERIYAHARAALYATVDSVILERAASQPIAVASRSSSRDEYLSRPATGEQLRLDAARTLPRVYEGRPPVVQFVISDGLNALAVNEQLPAVLPRVRDTLIAAGHPPGDRDLVVSNGRVRIGYQIGGLVGAEVVVHLIGERPGTGLNTLSAYVTYGRDVAGQPRWDVQLDHSLTSAVCGIHPQGKAPQTAAAEIVRLVTTMIEQKRSGVALAG